MGSVCRWKDAELGQPVVAAAVEPLDLGDHLDLAREAAAGDEDDDVDRLGDQPSRRDGAAGTPAAVPQGAVPAGAWVDIPPYQSDALVRGSEALSKTKDGRMARAVI